MKEPIAYVTDHAVLRYLERRYGLDIEAIRRELERKVDVAVSVGAAALVSEGLQYVMIDGHLVSCVPRKSIPKRRAVKVLRHETEEDED